MSDMGLDEVLGPDDARAYARFVAWSVGAGFRLAVVEVASPGGREALLAWTRAAVGGMQIVRLDEADCRSYWELLQEAFQREGGAELLVLAGLEEGRQRRRVCAQLNLTRNEQAREFAVPWVVVVDPGAALDLQQYAPDFSDFATLWVRARSR